MAGIQPADVVIGFDGEPISDPAELVLLLTRAPVGSEVPIELLRDGKKISITVRVGRRPKDS